MFRCFLLATACPRGIQEKSLHWFTGICAGPCQAFNLKLQVRNVGIWKYIFPERKEQKHRRKIPRTTGTSATPQGSGWQALPSYLLAWGQCMCTLMFEVGRVEFNFWLKGAFSLLNMDVLSGRIMVSLCSTSRSLNICIWGRKLSFCMPKSFLSGSTCKK